MSIPIDSIQIHITFQDKSVVIKEDSFHTQYTVRAFLHQLDLFERTLVGQINNINAMEFVTVCQHAIGSINLSRYSPTGTVLINLGIIFRYIYRKILDALQFLFAPFVIGTLFLSSSTGTEDACTNPCTPNYSSCFHNSLINV